MNLLHQVEMFQPEHINTRSQDLEDAWHDAGQFYWGNAQAWLENRLLFNNNSIGLPIPRHLVQDIDTYEDWIRAEWMYKAMQIGSN
jgi:N-acylneuraminate cytidylyltransferase